MNIDLRLAELLAEESDIRGHLARLRDLVVELDAQVVIELGVRTGRSTTALLAGVERTGGLLWSCDVVNVVAGMAGLDGVVVEHPQWEFVHGDDLAVVARAPRPADLVFIDTSHEYEHTRDELAAYAPLVRPGGCVVLHDTNDEWPAAQRAIFEWVDGLTVRPRLEVHNHDNGLSVIWL